MTDDNNGYILEMERYFSLDSSASPQTAANPNAVARDVADTILAMGGRTNLTNEEIAGEGANGNLSAQDALDIRQLRDNPALQMLMDRWNVHIEEFAEKAESGKVQRNGKTETITSEQRVDFLTRASELKRVITDLENMFAEADMFRPSNQDKQLLTAEGRKYLAGEPVKPVKPVDPTQATYEQLLDSLSEEPQTNQDMEDAETKRQVLGLRKFLPKDVVAANTERAIAALEKPSADESN